MKAYDHYYILDGDNRPRPIKHQGEFYDFIQEKRVSRRIMVTKLINPTRSVMISTIFMHIDHNFSRKVGPHPVLYETLVFGGPLNEHRMMSVAAEQAVEAHKHLTDMVFLEDSTQWEIIETELGDALPPSLRAKLEKEMNDNARI